MVNIVFKGDSDISEEQSKYIINVLDKLGFDNSKVNIEPIGKKGDNYVGLIKRIIVQGNNGEIFRMVAKIAPKNGVMRDKMNTFSVFQNENIMYSKVLPKYSELFENENIPMNQRIKIPKCYGLISESPNEMILLEDLNESDYVLLDRTKHLTNDTIKAVLRYLAIYHSLSYVIQYKYPEIYSDIKESLVNIWLILGEMEEFKMIFSYAEREAISLMDSEKHKQIIKGTTSLLMDISSKLYKYDIESKHSVIQHGDCWTNNILFKLEDEETVEAVLIDYQVCKLASPAHDILHLTFICTDHKTRSEHFNDWIEYYYAELSKSLDNFDMKANRIYTRDQLDADIRRHGKLIVAQAIPFASNMSRQTEEIVDLKESDSQIMTLEDAAEAMKLVNVKQSTVNAIKKRIEDCIESALELGLIQQSR